jgi:acetyl/propionyl-CoA carboxylase alpha subunit
VREYRVEGIATTLPFFDRVLHDAPFLEGDFDVGYVDRRWKSGVGDSKSTSLDTERGQVALVAAAVAAYRNKTPPRSTSDKTAASAWKQAGLREQLWSRL